MQVERSNIAKRFSTVWSAIALGFAIALSISASTTFAQNLPELEIAAPDNGSMFVPGQTVTISVQSATGASFPNGVAIIASYPIEGAGPVEAPPYTFSLTIPPNAIPGAYAITAVGVDSTGTLTTSTPVLLQVEPAAAPMQIKVQPAQIVESAIGASVSLQVVATFSDSSTANVTESANMSYTSADPTIVAADSSGSISAVKEGSTSVDVKYAPGGGSLEVMVPVTVLPPIVATSPATLAFGSVTLGNSSAPQTITVTNSANFPLNFLGVSARGDFGETDNCVSDSPIAQNNSCSVIVTFNPTSTGARTGSISLVNNAQVVATNVDLSGAGVSPSPTPAPTPSSESATPTVTATPRATATATSTATDGTATPTASATGSSGATPTATATATATLTATPTATLSATPTATRTATPTATAIATPTATATPVGTLSISPSSLNFGDKATVGKPSKAKHVTIKNNGHKKTGAAVSVEMESASPSVFTVKSQCDKTLAPGKKCRVSVIFTPTDDTTAETGSLMIFDSATGSPQSVGLSGMGKAPKKKK